MLLAVNMYFLRFAIKFWGFLFKTYLMKDDAKSCETEFV